MAIYINTVFTHFLALQSLATGKEMRLTLNARNFTLEVKYRGRYFTMLPMFQGLANGQLFHMDSLTKDVVGFGGWRPYRTIQHPYSNDKLLFKQFLRENGLKTPEYQPQDPMRAPSFDYVIKGARGSFGKQISGPYRGGTQPEKDTWTQWAQGSPTFTERFVNGATAKVWFWGNKPIYALAHAFPSVRGDGKQTLDELMRVRLAKRRIDWATCADREILLACLAFQRADVAAVVPEDTDIWFDYRYAQRYEGTPVNAIESDNMLAELIDRDGDHVQRMGNALADLMRKSVPAPVLLTADCMIDQEGHLWWLEMNTNSLMPPEGYAAMFDDLFP